MQLAIVGLGKMGYNLALNLKGNKFEVVAYDIASETRKKLAAEGVRTVDSLPELTKTFHGEKTGLVDGAFRQNCGRHD